MIIKKSLLIISMFIFAAKLLAQVEEPVAPGQVEQREKERFIDRLVIGGDIGLSFGTVTYIKLAPEIGYRLNSRLTAGLGPIYIYEKYKSYGLETSTYGGKAVISFTVIKGKENGGSFGIGDIVLHAENEIVNVEPIYEAYYSPSLYYYFGDRVWIDNLLLGPGLVQPISDRFNIAIYLLWDVTQNKFSYYNNPIFKFGFIYSLGK
jgi:hypothetical protein